MIALEAVQLRHIAAAILQELGVGGQVLVADVQELADGTWMVFFDDRHPDSRFPTFEIAVPRDWSRAQAERELRLVLRAKLGICPLCQQRAEIRRLIDREVFRVVCGPCGRFEIEHTVLDRLRQAFDARDEELIGMLPRLSRGVRRSAGVPVLTDGTWQSFAAD